MKERPILFNTAMVQAILASRKTQTRRSVGKELGPGWFFETPPVFGKITSPHRLKGRFGVFIKRGINTDFPECDLIPCPFGEVGDRLWVRESFRLFNSSNECGCSESPCGCPRNGTPIYRATHDDGESKWKPSIHMPRAACRIILEITNVRVERVIAISDSDAKAEGVEPSLVGADLNHIAHVVAFQDLWQSIYGNWDSHPWVWVIEFKVLTTNGAVPEVAA
jgi:hypothetical protein